MTANPPNYNHEPSYHIQWYKLKYRKPVPCSCGEANKLLSSSRKRVRSTYIGAIWVSTVFLCLDHGCDPTHPLLFETMALNADFEDLGCLHTHMA